MMNGVFATILAPLPPRLGFHRCGGRRTTRQSTRSRRTIDGTEHHNSGDAYDGETASSARAAGAPAALPEIPLREREWLRAREATAFVGVCYETLTRWRKAGLLPVTTRVDRSKCLYSRADLQRVMSAPRRGKVGVPRPAVLTAIRSGGPSS